MSKAYYTAAISDFVVDSNEKIIGYLNKILEFDRDVEQEIAWEEEIVVLKRVLGSRSEWSRGYILFEYAIPRLCGRIDAVVLLGQTVFVLEFKVGEKSYPIEAKKQVLEYCFDLKYFHEASEPLQIVPILVCTKSKRDYLPTHAIWDKIDGIACSNGGVGLERIFQLWTRFGESQISLVDWESSRYAPTPTIIEAAIALYEHHDVKDITKTSDDEHATNLTKTTNAIRKVIEEAQRTRTKKICFVTGVPGAGKTLVGLNLATSREINQSVGTNPVFLSGNGPLVDVLQHALQADAKKRRRLISKLLKEKGLKDPPPEVAQYFSFALKKTFVQGIYGFLKNALEGGGADCRVAIFDESQRCWTRKQMTRKHKKPTPSEASCLIGQMNKNDGWAVIVCLVGGGQEIHTGESGIVEWIKSINEDYRDWDAYVSDELLHNPEPFDVDQPGEENKVRFQLADLSRRGKLHPVNELHLGVSLRSFRNERVSAFADAVVENDPETAKVLLSEIQKNFPVVLTRSLDAAKKWVRNQSKRIDDLYVERFGAVASSGASRIRPEGIAVPGLAMNVPKWMLGSEKDVDSSYFLELAASEFKIQGLEIDYALMIWESDFRHVGTGFAHREFRRGKEWGWIRNPTRQNYLKNAYRVLLTRARQGMVIYVPKGNAEDQTRVPGNYNGTYQYLKKIGIKEIFWDGEGRTPVNMSE